MTDDNIERSLRLPSAWMMKHLRISLRDLLWSTILVAVAVAWYLEAYLNHRTIMKMEQRVSELDTAFQSIARESGAWFEWTDDGTKLFFALAPRGEMQVEPDPDPFLD